MKSLIAVICLMFLLSGCITFSGQQKGWSDSGVEISQTTADGTITKINVSGEATVEVDENGVISATSTDVGSSILKMIRP